MILVTGGLYQGKLAYVLENYHLDMDDVSDFADNNKYDFSKKVLRNFDRYVEYCTVNKIDMSEIIEQLSDKIIITCEKGCGIVPINPQDRLIRENTGRINNIIAQKSERVIRVFCGLGIVLK